MVSRSTERRSSPTPQTANFLSRSVAMTPGVIAARSSRPICCTPAFVLTVARRSGRSTTLLPRSRGSMMPAVFRKRCRRPTLRCDASRCRHLSGTKSPLRVRSVVALEILDAIDRDGQHRAVRPRDELLLDEKPDRELKMFTRAAGELFEIQRRQAG